MAWKTIPSLQKDIILLLAKEGAKTKNEISEALGKTYKNVLFAIKSLQDKGLISEHGIKDYRTQKFKKYWLTWHGVFQAYALGANPTTLKSQYIKHQGDLTQEELEGIEAVFSFMQLFGRERVNLFIECVDLSTSPPKIKYLPANLASPEELQKILKTLAKYKPVRERIKASWQEINKIFQETLGV